MKAQARAVGKEWKGGALAMYAQTLDFKLYMARGALA